MAAALVLVACGDDGDGQGTVCGDGATTLAALQTIDLDPASQDFMEAVDTLEAVEPPEEIAEDWDALVGVLVSLRDSESFDQDQLPAIFQRLQELDEERARIDDYIREEC